MANILPFDNASLGGTAVAVADFVHGSGQYSEAGQDIRVVTADNRIHNIRQSVARRASFEAYGDKSSLNSPAGLGQAIVLTRASTQVASFTGIVTATYNEQSKTTRIEIAGDPAAT
jgi:hypothetical protein